MAPVPGTQTPATAAPHKPTTQAVAFIVSLAEAQLKVVTEKDADGQPKREIELTCLQEGPGNLKDKRWYSAAAVEGLESLVYARRKLFVDHLNEGAAAGADSLRDWAATILKTWLAEGERGKARKVRAKVHEDWLWQRCLEAPGEIALSIEGVGAGHVETREGQEWMVIEKIHRLNAFKFVPYPGNAAMGVDLAEGAPAPAAPTEEDHPMDFSKLTLEELRKARPDLLAAVIAEQAKAQEGAKADSASVTQAVAGLREEFKAKLDEQAKAQGAIIQGLQAKLDEAEKKLDASEIREKLALKNRLIEQYVKESGLPAEAVTERFLARLRALTEREVIDEKGAKKVLGLEEQVKAEVEEQKRLVTPALATVRGAGGGAPASGEKLTEDEQQFLFEQELMKQHQGVTLAEYRKARDAKKQAAAA